MWLGAVTRTLAAVTVIGFCQVQFLRAVIRERSNDIESIHKTLKEIHSYTERRHKRNAFFDFSEYFGISNDTQNDEPSENTDVTVSETSLTRHGHVSSPEWLNHVTNKDNRRDDLSGLEIESSTQVEDHEDATQLVDQKEVANNPLYSDSNANNEDKTPNRGGAISETNAHTKMLLPQNISGNELQYEEDKSKYQMSLMKHSIGKAHTMSWFDLLMWENRDMGWVTVNFILGVLLFSLGILSLYRLLSLRECSHILPRTHFVTIHLLIFVASTLKSVYLFHLTYGSRERLPLVLILLLNDTSLPCLFSALSIILLMMFNAVDLRVMNPKYSTIHNLSIFIVGNIVLSFISDIIIGTAYSRTLLIIARVSLIFMALMISVLYMHKYSKIIQISQLLKREFQGEMKLLVAPTDSPSRRKKTLKQILVCRLHLWCQVILGTSWSLVVYSFCHLLNTIFLVTSFVPAWAWWIFHIISCLTETHLALSILLAASLTQRYDEKKSLLSHFFVISFSSPVKTVRKSNANNDNSIYQRVSLSSVTESTKYTSHYNDAQTVIPNVTCVRSPSCRAPRSPRHKHATVRRSATFTGRVDRPTVSPYGRVMTPVPPVARAGSASQIAIYSPGSAVYSQGSAIYSPRSEIYNPNSVYSPGSNIYTPGSVASMLVQEEGFIRIRNSKDYEGQSIVKTPLPPPPQLCIPPPPPIPEQEMHHFTHNNLSGTNYGTSITPQKVTSEISQTPISDHKMYNTLENNSAGVIRTPSEIYNHSRGSTSPGNSIYSSIHASPKIYQNRSELNKSSPRILKNETNLSVTKEENENKVPNNSLFNESNYSLSPNKDLTVASLHSIKKSPPSMHNIKTSPSLYSCKSSPPSKHSLREINRTPPNRTSPSSILSLSEINKTPVSKASPPSINSSTENNKIPQTSRRDLKTQDLLNEESIIEIDKTNSTEANVLTNEETVDDPYKKQNGNLNFAQPILRDSTAKSTKPLKRTHSAVGYNSVKNQIYAALPSKEKFGSLRLSQMRKRAQLKGKNNSTTKLINKYLETHPRVPKTDGKEKCEMENICDKTESKESLESDEKDNSNESLKREGDLQPKEGEEEEEDFSYYQDDTDWAQDLIKSSSLLAEFYCIKEAREKEKEKYLAQQEEDIKEEEE